MATLEFWFDFSSPYAYFAAREIDDLAARHGRTALWRPFLLGAIFAKTGMQALTQMPMRGDYARHDWERLSRLKGVPYRLPERHPVNPVAAARACYALAMQDEAASARLARAFFHGFFAEGKDLGSKDVVAEIISQAGFPQSLVTLSEEQDIKAGFRRQTEEAEARGIFGAPFIIVDAEPFWGHDRLPMVEKWLERGGF